MENVVAKNFSGDTVRWYRNVEIYQDNDDYRPFYVPSLDEIGYTCRFRRLRDAKAAITRAM